MDKDYFDRMRKDLETIYKDRIPDGYLVYRTDGFSNMIVGGPIAVYRNISSFERDCERICRDTDTKFGITVGYFWFDDEVKQ